MKYFYYKKDKQTRRTYGGLNVKASIYTVKKGLIVKVGTCSWSTASYPGETSAVFQALLTLKQIQKKWEKSSISPWSSGGYFSGEVCNHYSIQELA